MQAGCSVFPTVPLVKPVRAPQPELRREPRAKFAFQTRVSSRSANQSNHSIGDPAGRPRIPMGTVGTYLYRVLQTPGAAEKDSSRHARPPRASGLRYRDAPWKAGLSGVFLEEMFAS